MRSLKYSILHRYFLPSDTAVAVFHMSSTQEILQVQSFHALDHLAQKMLHRSPTTHRRLTGTDAAKERPMKSADEIRDTHREGLFTKQQALVALRGANPFDYKRQVWVNPATGRYQGVGAGRDTWAGRFFLDEVSS